jgi:purine-binding chemotaxis protein CheW
MRELFLTSFGGMRYGIWKDEILSVRDIDALHRIPLSPARIAGIMIDNGKTVTLMDLSMCLGCEFSPGIGHGSILLMEEGEKVTGFVVSGEIDTQPIPPELLFPLPDYLKTPVFDSCAIHDGIPIPIVNIAELDSRLLKADEELVVPFRIPAAPAEDISGMDRIGYFSAGGEIFAVSAAGIDDRAIKPGPITPLPNTPPYVRGVTFLEGRLLPVIDMTERITRQSAAPESVMLIAGIAGVEFGLLIDGDGGTLSAEEVTIQPAPLIAQTSWLKQVVVHEGELIPLIDLAMALSPDPGAGDEKPLWQRYSPASGFPALFAGQDADVVEFSLLGERHALPKQEVEDVIAFKHCRAFPGAPPIVIGVAEHNGEILPVVDLAMMFGRRSLATPVWRMMFVSNGDFRALVITETVFKERRLPLNMHRSVPIHLPHDLMYGCYPDAEAVRLILNVEAISVYFEKSLIQKFLPTLSYEMRMMSAEAEPAHEVASVAEPSQAEPEVIAVQEQASMHQEADEQELQQQEAVESSQVQEAITEAPEIASEPELDTEREPMDVELVTASPASTQESLSSSGEWSGWAIDEALEQVYVPPAAMVSEELIEPEPALSERSTDEEYIVAEQDDLATASSQIMAELQQQAEVEDAELIEAQEAEVTPPEIAPEPEPEPEQMELVRSATPSAITEESLSTAGKMSADEGLEQEHVLPAATVSEITIMPETNAKEAIPSELAIPLHSVSSQQLSGESTKTREPIVMSEQLPAALFKTPAQKEPAQTVLAAASSQAAPLQAKPGGQLASDAAAPASDTSRPFEPVSVAVSTTPSGPYHTRHQKPSVWKSRIAYGVLAAVLVAVIYFMGTSHTPDVEKPVIEPAKIEQAKVKAEPVKTQAEPAKEKAEQARTQAEQDELLAAQAIAKAKAEQVLVLSKEDIALDEPPRPVEKLRAPLELDIPQNMPVDIDVYVVVKNDTLWSISERFTGDPYNYPRIAGENKIANPDLIFPGQKIRLKK